PLMHEEVVALSSPAYQRAQGLRRVADLARAVRLQQTTRPSLWADWFAAAGHPVAQAARGPRFEQFSMIAQAAVHGLGAALLPRFLVQEEIDSGALVPLPGPRLQGPDAYHLVVPDARAETPLVQALRDWLLAECAGKP
ncbi:MAG: LysR family transcriptional regulator, partial [Curvibacter sp.]